jgi:catechol 2,3-dioxygenase-like lactoylglutathione lyase family enzyme
MPTLERALHLALTVRDMRASADWYERVLGFDFVMEFEVAPGAAGIGRILLLHQHSGFLLGLCNQAGRTGDSLTRCGRAWITLPWRSPTALSSIHGQPISITSGFAHSPCANWATRRSCRCRTRTVSRSN